MKKIIAILSAFCLMGAVMPGYTASAVSVIAVGEEDTTEQKTYENLTYQITEENTVTITGCDDSAETVVIPSEIDGLPVTCIGSRAFQAHLQLTSVTIPETVTLIKSLAFASCQRLTSIVIPEGVTKLESGVFSESFALQSITLPKSLTSFSAYIFTGTQWLKDRQAENPLVIVNDILIDGSACSGEVVIPDGVVKISQYAFYYNKEITSVVIPDSVVSIEMRAFSGCENLTDITIPETAAIGTQPFSGTAWLKEKESQNPIVVINHTLTTGTRCSGDIIIPDDVKIISQYAFTACQKITSVTIPESVTRIEKASFQICPKLTDITILNPECDIDLSCTTISNESDPEDRYNTQYFHGTIHGYANSTAQAYAEANHYTFEAIDGEVTTVMFGDVNQDNSVDIMDIILLNKAVFGKVTLNETQKKAADVTQNGSVDAEDSLNVMKYIVKLIDSLPV